jgi:ribonuclease HII
VVGVVVVDLTTGRVPRGTADSKELSDEARRALRPRLLSWCVTWALGEASATEIDDVGIVAAQGLATARAFGRLPVAPTAIIVDGPHDFATAPLERAGAPIPEVHPIIDADASCGSVAAASVLAKVARDDQMVALALRSPGFGFERNKGYGTKEHNRAVTELGLTTQHRRSWAIAGNLAAASAP